MGRPLSRQQFVGANANNNIKVHFYNGNKYNGAGLTWAYNTVTGGF
jgi:hypothetical protein